MSQNTRSSSRASAIAALMASAQFCPGAMSRGAIQQARPASSSATRIASAASRSMELWLMKTALPIHGCKTMRRAMASARRKWHRHSRRHPRQSVPALLHHQTHRRGDGARPVDQLRHHHAASRSSPARLTSPLEPIPSLRWRRRSRIRTAFATAPPWQGSCDWVIVQNIRRVRRTQ